MSDVPIEPLPLIKSYSFRYRRSLLKVFNKARCTKLARCYSIVSILLRLQTYLKCGTRN